MRIVGGVIPLWMQLFCNVGNLAHTTHFEC